MPSDQVCLLVLSREEGNIIPIVFIYSTFPYSPLRTSKLRKMSGYEIVSEDVCAAEVTPTDSN